MPHENDERIRQANEAFAAMSVAMRSAAKAMEFAAVALGTYAPKPVPRWLTWRFWLRFWAICFGTLAFVVALAFLVQWWYGLPLGLSGYSLAHLFPSCYAPLVT